MPIFRLFFLILAFFPISLISTDEIEVSGDPLVFVIIPVSLGRFHVASDALKSVFLQEETESDEEGPFPRIRVRALVILNNLGSHESSFSMENLPPEFHDRRVSVLRDSRPGLSVGASRNIGLIAAKEHGAEWVAFLDSDDIWLTNKLRSQLTAMTHGARLVSLASCSDGLSSVRPRVRVRRADGRLLWQPWTHFDSDPKNWPPGTMRTNAAYHFRAYRHLLGRYGYVWPRRFDKSLLSRANPVITSSVVLHRRAFDLVALFREDLELGGEDIDFWLRLVQTHDFVYLHEPLVVYDETHGYAGAEAMAIDMFDSVVVGPDIAKASWAEDEDWLGVLSKSPWKPVSNETL